jgi:hypothetical protein
MSVIWSTLTVDTVKNAALGLSAASLVIGLIMMKVVSSIVGKVVSLVIFLAIALAGYSQRAAVIDCANAVKSQATATASVETTCTFFGQDITVKVPQPSK